MRNLRNRKVAETVSKILQKIFYETVEKIDN